MVSKMLLILVKLLKKSDLIFDRFLNIKYAKLTNMFKAFVISSFVSLIFFTGSFFNKACASPPSATNEASSFEQAVDHLHKKEFEQAQTILMKLLEEKPNSIPLLYNLGLTFYQQKKQAEARAYWRRAIFNNPYNTKVLASLKHIGDTLPFWLTWPSDIVWAIQFLLWASFVFLIYKKKFLVLSRIWPMLAIPIQVISLLYFYPRTQNYATLVQNTSLHSDSNSSAPVLFEQKAGVLLKIKKTKNNWSYVILSDIKEGWIPSEFLIPLKNTDKT